MEKIKYKPAFKKLSWTWILLFFIHSISYGQVKPGQELDGLADIIKTELAKAGISNIGVYYRNENNRSGFQLQLLSNEEADHKNILLKAADAFHLLSDNNSVSITATSINGLRNGIYWYLGYLGYRFYFPESTWHYIPDINSAYKPVKKIGEPSYLSRRIWYDYGTDSDKADIDYNHWSVSNLLGGISVNAGHSYDGIVKRNKAVFLQHPEYFAQKVKKGIIPRNPKFEVSNKALVELCIQDAITQVELYKKRYGQAPTSISMDPSDGGGFSTSAESLKIGGPSEQVFYLANKVASALKKLYPSVKVGLYAYNLHAVPPKFDLESNIIVLIATAYNQSSYSMEDLMEIWKKKNVTIGIRDYLGVLAWDWDMPGQVRGSKVPYVTQIKEYYKKGALYYSGETNIGWISRGIGHYLAAKLLWDVNCDVEQVKKEFFINMFGKSAPIMQQLYNSWDIYRQPVPMDGNLLDWFNLVDKAANLEPDIKVQERLNQVRQYLYYVILYKNWREDPADEKLVDLLNFAYRVKEKGIISSYPLFRTLANSAVAGKKNMRFNDPEAKWKANKKIVSSKEIIDKIKIAKVELESGKKTVLTNWPEKFSKERFSASSKPSPIKLRGIHKIIFSIGANKPAFINLKVGFIKAKNYKPLSLEIYKYNQELSVNENKAVLQITIEPGHPLESFSLASLEPGVYMALIDDSKGGFQLSFSGDVLYGIVADNQTKVWTLNRTNMFFEIATGTNEFIVHTDGVVTLKSPTGRIIDLQDKHPVTNVIEVKKGEAGLWKMERQSGRLWIQGILPVVNNNLNQLLRK